MTEALFYQLEGRALEDFLPGLLEKTRERGQRAGIRVGTAERMAVLDSHLWTYSETTFLAHGTAADGHAERQPVYLTTENENPNRAGVLFFVGGALPENWRSPDLKSYSRIVVIFDGRDPSVSEPALAAWKEACSAGLDTTLWKQNSAGKWEKQTR